MSPLFLSRIFAKYTTPAFLTLFLPGTLFAGDGCASLITNGVCEDPSAVSAVDVLGREIGFGTGRTALSYQTGQGAWMGGYLTHGSLNSESVQDLDTVSRGVVLGYGLGWQNLSVFIGYGQAEAYLEDDETEARIRSYFWGLATHGDISDTDWRAALYTGGTHNKIESPSSLAGSTDYDGRLIGVSLQSSGMVWSNPTTGITGVDFTVQADVVHHQTQSYTLSGPDGGIEERSTVATALKMELGIPFEAHSTTFRPYAGYTFRDGTGDDLNFSTEDGSLSFGSAEYLHEDLVALGISFDAPQAMGLSGHLEAAREGDSAPRYGFSVGMSF